MKVLAFLFVFINNFYGFETSGKDEVIFGVSNIRPWFYEENGKYKGITYELYEKLAKDSGIKLKYIVEPYKRIQQSFANGKFQLTSDIANANTKKYGEKLGKFITVNLVVVGIEKTVNGFVSKTKKKPKYKVCMLRGVQNMLESYRNISNFTYATTLEQCLQLLNKNELI